MPFTLPARQPFSLSAVIDSHGWCQLPPFTTDEQRATLGYTAQLQSGKVIHLQITPAPQGVAVGADQPVSPAEEAEVRAMLAWMLALEQDFSAFYTAAAQEPRLAGAAANARGRVLRSPTLFEDTIKTILTTNTAWSGTKRMVRNLVELLGEPDPQDPAQRAFPTAEAIAATSAEVLRTQGGFGYRTPYVLELAQAVASGALELEAYKHSELPTVELRKRLLAIKGVGGYAAANLLMLLGRYDFIPVDSWAMKMVSQEFHGGSAIGPAEVEAAFAHWGEWKGLAYFFWEWQDQG